MTELRIRLTATPESRRQAARILAPFIDAARRLERPIYRIAGDALAAAFNENFETEGHGSWPQLSPDWTVPERRSLGFAGEHPILQRDRALKRSIVERSHPGHIREISTVGAGRLQMQIGSSDIRYNLLHFGGRTALNTVIPPRPMAILHESQYQRIERALIFAADQAMGIR